MSATQTLQNGKTVVFDSVQDKSGKTVAVGDEVNVGAPKASDIHVCAFRGEVVDIYADGVVCVKDQQDDCFDVDADNIELCERQ